MDIAEQIEANARRLRLLHDRLHEEFRKAPHGPAHHAACAQFHAEYHALSLPGELADYRERIKAGRHAVVQPMLAFLEKSPWFFRSGYIQQDMLRMLKQVPLTAIQRQRCERLIIRCMDDPFRGFIREYARLAGALQSQVVAEAAWKRIASPRPDLRKRAERVLRVMQSRSSARRADSK